MNSVTIVMVQSSDSNSKLINDLVIINYLQ